MKINIEIEELLKVKQQNETIKDRLVYLNEKLTKLSIKEKAYHQRTEDELADIKRLEELGLRSLFKKVMGNLDEAIEKERKEYLGAVLKHRSIEEEIQILEFERDLLTKRFREPSKIEEKLTAAIKKKEFVLRSHDSKFIQELFKRESELGRYKLLRQKCNSILKKAALSSKIINEIKIELLEVIDWPPSGKGKYASVIKKKYIDKARAKALKAKVSLDEFGEIAQKLFSEVKMTFELKPFEEFLDRFYDNLINDYVIKKQLETTLLEIDKILIDISNTTDMVIKETEKYSAFILEKEKSLQEYTRDYEK